MSPHDVHDGDETQLVAFRVGAEEFAVDILQLRRILAWQPPAPLPSAPAYVAGSVPCDGGAVPVVDLRALLGLPAGATAETRILVLDLGERPVGVVVDVAREMLRVESTAILAPPAHAHGLAARAAVGLLPRPGRTIVVLNALRLLTREEREALRSLEPVP